MKKNPYVARRIVCEKKNCGGVPYRIDASKIAERLGNTYQCDKCGQKFFLSIKSSD